MLKSQFMKEVGIYVMFSSSIAFVAGLSIGHRKPVETEEEVDKDVDLRPSIHASGLQGTRSSAKAVV